ADVSRVSAHQPVMRRMPARKVGRSTRMHNPAVVGVFHEIRVNDPKNDLEPSVHLFFPIRTRGVFGATCGLGSRCPYIGLLQTDIACSPSMARALLSRVSGANFFRKSLAKRNCRALGRKLSPRPARPRDRDE